MGLLFCQLPGGSFDRTYEGLKRGVKRELGRGPAPFDRTYEGLKRHDAAIEPVGPHSFDRTYEGLKHEHPPGPSLRLWPLLTVPMRV